MFIILYDTVGLTIAEKLNNLCPQFARWDALYGDKQNINPSHTADASSSEEDEDNEEEEENVDLSAIDVIPLTSIAETPSSDDSYDSRKPNRLPKVVSSLGKSSSSLSKRGTNPVLAELSAATLTDASENGESRVIKKARGDFSSLYALNKTTEYEITKESKKLELDIQNSRLEQEMCVANARLDHDKAMAESSLVIANERLQHDKSMAEASLSMQKERLRMEEKTNAENSKKEVMLALIARGLSITEIREYLNVLKE